MGQESLVCLSVDVRGWSKLKSRCQWAFVEVSSPTSPEALHWFGFKLNPANTDMIYYPQIYSISLSSLCNISICNIIFPCSKDARLPWSSQGVTHCRDVDANGLGLGQGWKAGALGLPRSSKKGMSSTLPTYCARVFLLGCFKYACFCFHHGSPTSLLSGQVIMINRHDMKSPSMSWLICGCRIPSVFLNSKSLDIQNSSFVSFPGEDQSSRRRATGGGRADGHDEVKLQRDMAYDLNWFNIRIFDYIYTLLNNHYVIIIYFGYLHPFILVSV